ncbi:MAG: methyltransferase family protein [Planctomycetota bacterium]
MNLRLLVSRVAIVLVAVCALFTSHAWDEHGAVDSALSAAGDFLLIAGCIGRIWCAAHIAGRKNRELVDVGPFSICRNPLYFFTFLALVGAGLAFESLTIAALFATVFFLTHWPTILREERFLTAAFGEAYERYLARVPRFVPNPRLYRGTPEITIGTAAFTRAMLEAAPIPLVYLAAQAIEAGHESHLLPVLAQLY